MNKTMRFLAGIFVATMLTALTETASAAPISGMAIGSMQTESAAPSLLSEVKHYRKYRKHRRTYNYRHHGRRYDHRYHGRRYAYRRRGYDYFYGGFWYAQPWWGVPVYNMPRRVYRYDAHVEWCLDRYRSYDPESDTFLGYDGLRRYCNSPYR